MITMNNPCDGSLSIFKGLSCYNLKKFGLSSAKPNYIFFVISLIAKEQLMGFKQPIKLAFGFLDRYLE